MNDSMIAVQLRVWVNRLSYSPHMDPLVETIHSSHVTGMFVEVLRCEPFEAMCLSNDHKRDHTTEEVTRKKSNYITQERRVIRRVRFRV